MVTALNPGAITRYHLMEEREVADEPKDTPAEDRPYEPKPGASTFLFRDLTATEEANVRDLAGRMDPSTGSYVMTTNRSKTEALLLALVGWEDFNFPDGGPVPFPEEGKRSRQAVEQAIQHLLPRHRLELANHAWRSVTSMLAEK